MKVSSFVNRNHLIRILIVILANFYYAVQLFSNWPLIDFSGFRGSSRYIDLESILTSASCFKENDLGVYSNISNTRCAGYLYGRELIYLLQNIIWGPNVTFIIGTAVVLAGMATLSWFALKDEFPLTLTALVIFTPGISLLYERGNFDLVVFLMVILSALLFNKQYFLTSYFVILLASMFKFYTLPLIFVIVAFMKKENRTKWFLFIITIFVTVHLAVQINALPKLPSTWFISFGAGVFGEYLNLVNQTISNNDQIQLTGTSLVGLTLVVISQAVFLKFSSRFLDVSRIKNISTGKNVHSIGIFSFIVFLSCYLTGISYDYRIIFYSIAIFGAWPIWKYGKVPLRISIVISLVFTTIFPPTLIYPRVIFQLIGDFCMLAVVPAIAFYYGKTFRETFSDAK